MPDTSQPNSEHLMEEIIKNMRLDFFENEEIIAVIDAIDSFDRHLRQKVLALCFALSHASSSLVSNTLKRISTAAQKLEPEEMERWFDDAADILESQGIDPFIDFVAKVPEDGLEPFMEPERLRLREVTGLLETYLMGISGLDLTIGTDSEPYTDTDTVYLPPVLSRSRVPQENLLLYVLMAAHKWGQIACGTLMVDLHEAPPEGPGTSGPEDDEAGPRGIEALFRQFPERAFAVDLFSLLEAFMLDSFLRKELPGLMSKAEGLKAEIFSERPRLEDLSEKSAFAEGIYHYYLSGNSKGTAPEALAKMRDKILSLRGATDPNEIVGVLFAAYDAAKELKGDYKPQRPVFFLGTIKPERVSRRLEAKREEAMKKLEGVITKLMNMPDFEPRRHRSDGPAVRAKPVRKDEEYLAIKGKIVALDEEINSRIKELGGVPGGVLVKGSDVESGSTYVTLKDLTDEEDEPQAKGAGVKYDEWDYKRGDYKRQWCSLFEVEIQPGEEPFVELVRKRHGGYIAALRKRFEIIRTVPKMLRRQKDGDCIDIDAAVEAFSDMRAGLSPEEALFVRTDRQERNIAVLFLIDMSGSTKGWINDAEKEALVLMCEALEALGDRYAIYGFSGMSRTRCEYYKIKSFDEPYLDSVKGRIAGIAPKDYTRMGAPIRHSASILNIVEAKTKLLITLSDGKPEDWGAYKGDYGIEDTRKALIEARERGIHPFCITIDKEAGSYLSHMYGETNYIVIDEIRKLPNRITEIYRRLTI